MFMAQGALSAAGVRRVGYGLEVGHGVRTAGGAGAYCVATRTACYLGNYKLCQWPSGPSVYLYQISLKNAEAVCNKLCRRPPRYASNACKLTIYSYLFARWHLFRYVGYLRHQHCISNKLTFDLLTLKVVSESRVTWATSVPLPRPLCSRFRPDIRDRRQTDRCQTASSLNASAL